MNEIIISEIRENGSGIRIHHADGKFLIEAYNQRKSGPGLEIVSLECDGFDLDLLHAAIGRMQERYLDAIVADAVEKEAAHATRS
ncbi:MAG: hypothetical protein ACYCR5_09425 [Leptospirillum sp.]